ncbi:hypothetical protein [Anabaena catenula]|uniref:Uncharacterized protein n=1 Tax=Anabaena catenula FACHB-362 TaxID=2692877 RepID=A0ABR8JC05_9NOST|nr:hypothetical protein [Anabaena catenula]MBD2694985.1 hypothetical protein [Anabaena catenula FACHB-362]
MKLSHILPLVVGSAAAGVFASMSPAQALTTWTLNSTTFSDGSYVTGSFNYDETNTSLSAAAYTGVSILLFNNTNTQLASYTLANLADSNGYTLRLGDGTYWVRIYNAPSFWTNVSSPVFITGFTAYGQSATFGSNQLGSGSSGTITASAAVPFDIPGGATIPTVGSLLALGAMRKVKKSLALKTRIANPVTTTVS